MLDWMTQATDAIDDQQAGLVRHKTQRGLGLVARLYAEPPRKRRKLRKRRARAC